MVQVEFEGVSLFTGLDYWNGLLDWTTGLTQTAIKCLFQCRTARSSFSLSIS